MSSDLRGLAPAEVQARRAAGQVNRFPNPSSRSYGQIIRENVFTFINNILFGLGIALVVLGRPSDALISVGIILINLVVSLVQEIRAKRTLDRIALLTRPTANVVRGGREETIDPGEIVLGDLLVLRPGDQVVVDGVVISGRPEVDESLLTGESDPISKKPGDPVYSGSFCVSGSAYYEGQKVGAQSLANQLTASARKFRRVLTPLQQQINLVLRLILLAAVYFEVLMAVSALVNRTPLVESVRMSVVIIGLVPNGLFVTIAVAYALGAVRIAGKGALVQQSNAIESLSNVDVLCLDKTGTLTANRFQFQNLLALGITEEDLRQRLGDFCASTTAGNRTNEAIAAACPGQKQAVMSEVPFSSERKWSALSFTTSGQTGLYVLGALEVLAPALQPGSDDPELGEVVVESEHAAGQAQPQIRTPAAAAESGPGLEARAEAWTLQGLRVLLFAYRPGQMSPGEVINEAGAQAHLPQGLVPLGLISLSDELRPEASQTLAGFAQAGVRLKIISGDNPQTVAALARQAGLGMGSALSIIAGPELARLDPDAFSSAVEQVDVFGRITPHQKEEIVKALKAAGHYVAMTGDGVNDVLSLKQANLAIAMQSGSQAARGVADIILLGDSFASIPFAVMEGQRIINGMQDILKLFITRIGYTALLIISTAILGAFPYDPKQGTILTFLTVGLPSLALVAWARPGKVPRANLMIRRLLHFVLPAAVLLSLAGLGVFLAYILPGMGDEVADVTNLALARTGLISFSILCGLLLIPFVEPPSPAWAGGDRFTGDQRPGWLALGALAGFIAILLIPPLRTFFDLYPLPAIHYLLMAAGAVIWGLLLRWVWRSRVLERFLDTRLDSDEEDLF